MSEKPVGLTARQAFEAACHFIQAYWERGERKSDDLAMLLGDLEADPAQWNDWIQAVSKVERQDE